MLIFISFEHYQLRLAHISWDFWWRFFHSCTGHVNLVLTCCCAESLNHVYQYFCFWLIQWYWSSDHVLDLGIAIPVLRGGGRHFGTLTPICTLPRYTTGCTTSWLSLWNTIINTCETPVPSSWSYVQSHGRLLPEWPVCIQRDRHSESLQWVNMDVKFSAFLALLAATIFP